MKHIIVTLLALSLMVSNTLFAQTPPSDPAATCQVTKNELSGWFSTGTIKNKGFVNAADSLHFPADNTVCDFYKWSAQMFLWLTSNDATGGGWVFDSTTFFDVSGSVGGKRTLLSNADVSNFALRSAKPEDIDETGQAGGSGVLISQKNSLVYYGIHVNDVYAYFLSAVKNGYFKTNAFPTTSSDLQMVEKYAKQTFADGNALTLELKTSWVDATTVDAKDFITIKAQVPKYDKTSTTEWTLNGTENLQLALVGIHIVGTVANHPEMVWATYEHINNSPDNNYFYKNSQNKSSKVDYSSAGDWIFMQSGGSMTGANTEKMNLDSSGNIIATAGNTNSASNTFRVNPWGSAGNAQSSAVNNTELIALNNSIRTYLSSKDIRRNYLQGGALWTQHGEIPPLGTQKGSLELANTTMETYHQDINCFVCHSGSTSIGLSHIFDEIQPLPSSN